jgi:hypothetical protein
MERCENIVELGYNVMKVPYVVITGEYIVGLTKRYYLLPQDISRCTQGDANINVAYAGCTVLGHERKN